MQASAVVHKNSFRSYTLLFSAIEMESMQQE